MLRHGEVTLSEPAWKEGDPDWTTVANVMGIEPPPPILSRSTPPPVPVEMKESHSQAQYHIQGDLGGYNYSGNSSDLSEQHAEPTPNGCSWSLAIAVSLLIPILGLLCGILLPVVSKKDKQLALPMIGISLVSIIVWAVMLSLSQR